jgi:hypothetical protein
MKEQRGNDPWAEARRITVLIDLAPGSIATCIRFLRKDIGNNKGVLSPVSRYCLRMLLKGANLRAALYYAALLLRPEKVSGNSKLTWDAYLEIFTLEELSYLIGVLFAFRRIKRGVSAEEFATHMKILHTFADIGALVGDAIPKIGMGRGLLLGSMRHLATAMFLGIDEKNFIKYRRALKLEDKFFDCESELAQWHCHHAHVGSYIIQLLGLGTDEATSFMQAASSETNPNAQFAPDIFRTRITFTWIEAFYNTGADPQIVHRGEYYPKAVDLQRITAAIATIRKDGSSLWMTKNKGDLPPEIMSRLELEEPAPAPPPGEEVPEDVAKQIETLSKEEE